MKGFIDLKERFESLDDIRQLILDNDHLLEAFDWAVDCTHIIVDKKPIAKPDYHTEWLKEQWDKDHTCGCKNPYDTTGGR